MYRAVDVQFQTRLMPRSSAMIIAAFSPTRSAVLQVLAPTLSGAMESWNGLLVSRGIQDKDSAIYCDQTEGGGVQVSEKSRNDGTLTSTSFKFRTPYTLSRASTTPASLRGFIAQVPS